MLIEPGSEVKLFSNVPLGVGHHLIARIGEKQVSESFLIPKMKILHVKVGNFIEIVVQNLSTQRQRNVKIVTEDLVLVCEKQVCEPLKIESFQIKLGMALTYTLHLKIEDEFVYRYVLPTLQSEQCEVYSKGLDEQQKNIMIEYYNNVQQRDPYEIRNDILKFQPQCVEELVEKLGVLVVRD